MAFNDSRGYTFDTANDQNQSAVNERYKEPETSKDVSRTSISKEKNRNNLNESPNNNYANVTKKNKAKKPQNKVIEPKVSEPKNYYNKYASKDKKSYSYVKNSIPESKIQSLEEIKETSYRKTNSPSKKSSARVLCKSIQISPEKSNKEFSPFKVSNVSNKHNKSNVIGKRDTFIMQEYLEHEKVWSPGKKNHLQNKETSIESQSIVPTISGINKLTNIDYDTTQEMDKEGNIWHIERAEFSPQKVDDKYSNTSARNYKLVEIEQSKVVTNRHNNNTKTIKRQYTELRNANDYYFMDGSKKLKLIEKAEKERLIKLSETSGVYTSSEALKKGHVGLNKVNPILNNIRSIEKNAASKIQMYWKHKQSENENDKEPPVLVMEKKYLQGKTENDSPIIKRITTVKGPKNNVIPLNVITNKGSRNHSREFKEGRVMLRKGTEITPESPKKIINTIGVNMKGNTTKIDGKQLKDSNVQTEEEAIVFPKKAKMIPENNELAQFIFNDKKKPEENVYRKKRPLSPIVINAKKTPDQKDSTSKKNVIKNFQGRSNSRNNANTKIKNSNNKEKNSKQEKTNYPLEMTYQEFENTYKEFKKFSDQDPNAHDQSDVWKRFIETKNN